MRMPAPTERAASRSRYCWDWELLLDTLQLDVLVPSPLVYCVTLLWLTSAPAEVPYRYMFGSRDDLMIGEVPNLAAISEVEIGIVAKCDIAKVKFGVCSPNVECVPSNEHGFRPEPRWCIVVDKGSVEQVPTDERRAVCEGETGLVFGCVNPMTDPQLVVLSANTTNNSNTCLLILYLLAN